MAEILFLGFISLCFCIRFETDKEEEEQVKWGEKDAMGEEKRGKGDEQMLESLDR